MSAKHRILVVGGGGFVGSHILTRLLERRFEVAVLDLFRPEGLSSDIDWIIGSAVDEAMLSAAVGGCRTVIFLAASSLPDSANADMAAEIVSHVRMAVKAAEISCSRNVETFIFASSGGTVYGTAADKALREDCLTRPITAYGASKVAVENYLHVLSRLRKMRCVSLRISNPFGPGQRAHRNQGFVAAAMAAVFSGETLECWGDGSVIRDFVYVDDVATAFARACEYDSDSCVVNIGSGRGHSLKQVITGIEQVTGRTIDVAYQRDRVFDVKSNVLDVELASKLLGWQPNTLFAEGLGLTAKWWERQARGAL